MMRLQKNGFEEKLEADFTPKFVVGYVKEKAKHPNADKLNVCTVDVGTEELQIVCGAAKCRCWTKSRCGKNRRGYAERNAD